MRDEDAVAPTIAADSGGATMETIAPSRRVQMLAPGTQVGRYVIAERLGWGGMGVVYRATDPRLGRDIALKLVIPSGDVEAAQRRLETEAQAMAKLDHPNVVGIHDIGTFGEQLFVAMELCSGGSLARWIRKPQPWREIVARFVAAGRGLAAAHRIGLVHRDFKPDNVLVAGNGAVKVSDFGLVRAAESASQAFEGTPQYMAPEQLELGSIDARADQFAFAVSVWEALSGEKPFVAEPGDVLAGTLAAIRKRAHRGTPRAPTRVVRVVERGLAPLPADRWPTLDAMLGALERCLATRWPIAVAAGVGVAGIAVAAYALTRPPPVDATIGDQLARALAPAFALASKLGDDPQGYRLALAATHAPADRLALALDLLRIRDCNAIAEIDRYVLEAHATLAAALPDKADAFMAFRAECANDPTSTMTDVDEIAQMADELMRNAPDKAIVALRHALRLAKQTRPALWLTLGDYLTDQQDCAGAALAYDIYLRDQPLPKADADAIRRREASCKPQP